MKKGLLLASLLLFFSALAACGKGKSGAVFKVTTSTVLSPPSSSKALPAASGDNLDNGFPDQLITPSAFTVAFKSFKFIQQNDNLTQGQTPISDMVLNATFEAPKVVELKTGETTEVAESSSDPRAGTYDRVEYEISYFEMVIPLCDAANRCEDRRLRFYLTHVVDPNLSNFSATAFDLLFSQSPNGFDFGWVSASVGLPTLIPITNLRPLDAFPIPADHAPPGPLFSKALTTPVVIPKKPKSKYIFTLNFDLTDLFFFDNTNDTTIDPTEPFHFNALVTDLNVSKDGKLQSVCPTPTAPCQTEPRFWPGIPPATVTVIEEPS